LQILSYESILSILWGWMRFKIYFIIWYQRFLKLIITRVCWTYRVTRYRIIIEPLIIYYSMLSLSMLLMFWRIRHVWKLFPQFPTRPFNDYYKFLRTINVFQLPHAWAFLHHSRKKKNPSSKIMLDVFCFLFTKECK